MAKAAQKKDDNVVEYDPFTARQTKDHKASAADNERLERRDWENQQFIKGLRELSNLESDMAGTKGEIGGVFKRAEQCGGWDKSDFKWAQDLQKKDAPKIIAMMERRLRIAKLLGHGVARQFSMFDEDRTPLEDRAYEEGYAAGAMRKAMTNPYGLESPAGQSYQRGFNEGTAFINKDLASKFGDGDGELIKGDADPDGEPDNDVFDEEND